MATEIKAPHTYIDNLDGFTLFLAGSIEEGKADPWQQKVVDKFADYDVLILNPRRENWDNTIKQVASDPTFSHQVNWELDGQEVADAILMYFDPKTKSPITLLELGLFVPQEKLYIVCPDGFWRKGNVAITCQRHHVPVYQTLDEGISALIDKENLIHYKK